MLNGFSEAFKDAKRPRSEEMKQKLRTGCLSLVSEVSHFSITVNSNPRRFHRDAEVMALRQAGAWCSRLSGRS